MDITSIGFLSETMFQRYNGIVHDHGTFTEVRTPDNYTFWFGNYLLLPSPPVVAMVPGWIAKFDACFADAPEVAHKCLQWPDAGGSAATRTEFERLGWEFDQTSVLVATNTAPVRPAPPGVVFRRIKSDLDWTQVLEQQVASRPEGFGGALYRAYKQKRLAFFRGLQDAGRGAWYGAFKGTELVADMGIFHRDGISRFQEVSTHPAHRRQGICAALVHHVSTAEQAQEPGNRMVILADAGEPAERIYTRLGYREVEQIQSVVLRPKGWDG